MRSGRQSKTDDGLERTGCAIAVSEVENVLLDLFCPDVVSYLHMPPYFNFADRSEDIGRRAGNGWDGPERSG